MATKGVSPAANLLRQSKLFSLPPPLRRPLPETLGSKRRGNSDTSTLPHPTVAAIETTPRAIQAGEWGLKRALPGKAGRTSTPVVRISALDNADHITDFESAADHVLTVQKFQEMDIPMTMHSSNGERFAGTQRENVMQSAFEAETSKDQLSANDKVPKQRWKFEGPYITGMSPLEFEQYVEKNIRHRRQEFAAFLREYLATKKASTSRSGALDRGEERQEEAVSGGLTAQEFKQGIKRLRNERHELWDLIWRFLDLPGQAPSKVAGSTSMADTYDRLLADTDDGPPSTHPSAGLAYTRADSHLHNHPALGPQRTRPPVHGRIIQHSNAVNAASGAGGMLIGVGGVVGTLASDTFAFADRSRAGQYRYDSEVEGGSKTWVLPRRASIDPNGRIRLVAEKANADTVAVWEQQLPPGTSFNPKDPIASLNAADRAASQGNLIQPNSPAKISSAQDRLSR